MAAGSCSSGCSVCLWRGNCLNPLLLRRLGHQDHLPVHTHSAPRSLQLGQRVSLAGAGSRRGRCCRASLAAGDLKSGDCLQGPWFRSALKDGQRGGNSACGLCITTNRPEETGHSWQWHELCWRFNLSSSKKLSFPEIVRYIWCLLKTENYLPCK